MQDDFEGIVFSFKSTKVTAYEFNESVSNTILQALTPVSTIKITLDEQEALNPDILSRKLSLCRNYSETIFDAKTKIMATRRGIMEQARLHEDRFNEAWREKLMTLSDDEKKGSKEEREYRAQAKVIELKKAHQFWVTLLSKVIAAEEDCTRYEKYVGDARKDILGSISALRLRERLSGSTSPEDLALRPEGDIPFGVK